MKMNNYVAAAALSGALLMSGCASKQAGPNPVLSQNTGLKTEYTIVPKECMVKVNNHLGSGVVQEVGAYSPKEFITGFYPTLVSNAWNGSNQQFTKHLDDVIRNGSSISLGLDRLMNTGDCNSSQLPTNAEIVKYAGVVATDEMIAKTRNGDEFIDNYIGEQALAQQMFPILKQKEEATFKGLKDKLVQAQVGGNYKTQAEMNFENRNSNKTNLIIAMAKKDQEMVTKNVVDTISGEKFDENLVNYIVPFGALAMASAGASVLDVGLTIAGLNFAKSGFFGEKFEVSDNFLKQLDTVGYNVQLENNNSRAPVYNTVERFKNDVFKGGYIR